MRFGFDAKRAFHNLTGLGNYSRFTIAALSKFFPENEYLLYTPPSKKIIDGSFAQKNNIRIIEPTGVWKHFASSWRSIQLGKQLQRDGVDIYHGLSHELPNNIQQSGIPSVVSMHDVIFLRYPQYYKYIDRYIYEHKFRAACNDANLVIAISQQTKSDLIHFFHTPEEKIRIVYQGCDPQFYQTVDLLEKQTIKQLYHLPDRYILSVGTIEERKNLVSIVNAMRALPKDIHLVAIGKRTDYAKQVDQAIASAGLGNRVQILDRVPFHHFPGIYQQALAFVYPSVYEGFGIPILEALNSGIPVIAANTSSLPEVGGTAALYCQPYQVDEMADHLLSIINNTTLAQYLIAKGYQQAALFKDEVTVKSLWSVYQELI